MEICRSFDVDCFVHVLRLSKTHIIKCDSEETVVGELIDRDQEHLRLLRLGFFVLAGFTSLFSLVSLFYIGLGTFVTFGNFPVN